MAGTSLADAISRDTTTQLAITLNIEMVVQNVEDVGVLENSIVREPYLMAYACSFGGFPFRRPRSRKWAPVHHCLKLIKKT